LSGDIRTTPHSSHWSYVPPLAAALAIGTAAAAAYYDLGLTLSHYDAKAHLVVARRILDSMTPGWMQIGAVWLPLPHLLNFLPVQVDTLYQTGLSGVAFSVSGFVLGASSLWILVARATDSSAAAWSAFAVYAAQPDVLYLQATPMTESLLMGLCLYALVTVWPLTAEHGANDAQRPAFIMGLACLTRYEAWPLACAIVVFTATWLLYLRVPLPIVRRQVLTLAAGPIVAVAAFVCLSRATTGAWLVTDGFFEIDQSTYRDADATLRTIWRGLKLVNGPVAIAFAGMALAGLLVSARRTRSAARLLLILCLAAPVVLPAYALWNGHPFRLRYMVPSTMVCAALVGIGVGLLPRYRRLAALTVIAVTLVETPPLSTRSPVVVESQRDASNIIGRHSVTQCLARDYDGTPILASMGSVAPFMHETSRIGLQLRDYIHEGIGQLWLESLVSARRHAGWVVIEEQAEGGDVLAKQRNASPAFLAGFEKQCAGGGVVLYRRVVAP
jgi:hypothetical protein